MRPDIQQIPVNTQGFDFATGDIHGNSNIIQQAIACLKSGDRLFIVGDLFDKGFDSVGVFRAIKEANQGRKTPRIYSVRGNHEEILIRAVDFFDNENKTDQDWPNSYHDNHPLVLLLKNDGAWIFQKNIQIKINTFFKQKEMHLSAFAILMKEMRESYEQSPSSFFIPELNEIIFYIKSLPYIMVVGDISTIEGKKNSFLVCHADMPFSDKELQKRLLSLVELEKSERDYVLWVRQNCGCCNTPACYCIKDKGRDSQSILAFCGHTSYNEVERNYRGYSVRKNTNIVNVDAMAYYYGQAVLVNVTTCDVSVLFDQLRQYKKPEPSVLNQIALLMDFFVQKKAEKQSVERSSPELFTPTTTSFFDDLMNAEKIKSPIEACRYTLFDYQDIVGGANEAPELVL